MVGVNPLGWTTGAEDLIWSAPEKFSNRTGQDFFFGSAPSPGSGFSPQSIALGVAAYWRQMVDRPKWSSRSSSLRLLEAPRFRGAGLILDTRPGRTHPRSQSAVLLGCHASSWLQRNGVFVFHMAWRLTASLRSTATRAFLKPDILASFMPHAFSVEKRRLRVSGVVAAS
jgi:hypothetical protein